MTRLIAADKLMEELDNIVYTRKAGTVDRHALQIISAIQNAPTVDAVPKDELIKMLDEVIELERLEYRETLSDLHSGMREGYLNVRDWVRKHGVKECCENCKYFYPFKSLRDGEWYYSHACVALIDIEEAALVKEVSEDGMCEMFDWSE